MRSENIPSAVIWYCSIVLIMGICFIVYYPGSHGNFIYDDYPNIISNPDITINSLSLDELLKAAHSSLSGPLKRPVSMLTFAVNYYFTGFDPYYYKITNILIHLMNGFLVGLLAYFILGLASKTATDDDAGTKFISIVVAAVWMMHPINLTSVLYTVQRMNSLAALFTLLGICLYIFGRTNLQNKKPGWLSIFIAFGLCGPLAILAKENGVLIYLYILLIEWVFFSRSQLHRFDRRLLTGLIAVFIIIPSVTALLYFIDNPGFIMDGYDQKNFTLLERLLTEARVIWFYIYLIILPNIKQMSLHHDDVELSAGLLEPVTTAVSIFSLIVVFVFSLKYREKYPVISFGILFYLIGHSIESTVLPLIIAFEHRNYLPSFGLVLAICFICLNQKFLINTLRIRQIGMVLLVIVLALSTNVRARQWGNSELLRFHELRHNPDSPRVNYEVGRFYAVSLDSDYVQDKDLVYKKADYYFNRVLDIEPENIEAMIGLLILRSSFHDYVDYEILHTLKKSLMYSQISATGTTSIKALISCTLNGECEMPDRVIQEVIEGIKANYYLDGRSGELLYTSISRYYLSNNSINLALEMARKALLMNPASLDMRVYLAALLIEMDRYDEAMREINVLRDMDKLDIYENKIEELSSVILNK